MRSHITSGSPTLASRSWAGPDARAHRAGISYPPFDTQVDTESRQPPMLCVRPLHGYVDRAPSRRHRSISIGSGEDPSRHLAVSLFACWKGLSSLLGPLGTTTTSAPPSPSGRLARPNPTTPTTPTTQRVEAGRLRPRGDAVRLGAGRRIRPASWCTARCRARREGPRTGPYRRGALRRRFPGRPVPASARGSRSPGAGQD
jgi:hypothetical protein